MILYINNSHCENIENLKNYLKNDMGSHKVVSEILDYGRSGDLYKWLKEQGLYGYARKVKEIDRSCTDTEYLQKLTAIIIGDTILVNKPLYYDYFTLKSVNLELNYNNVEVFLLFDILDNNNNEKYKIEIETNRGIYRGYINPSKYKKGNSKVKFTIDRNHLTKINNIRVENEIVKVNVNGGNFLNTINTINDYEYVDLGLPSGLKWATCNVGADSPEDYGDCYAWGEINTKFDYNFENSVTHNKNFGDISGNSKYDAARANWGGTWRLPNKEEMEELIKECTWERTTQCDVNGYKVVSKKNGNYIFFPADEIYWSSTPNKKNNMEAYHLYLCFDLQIINVSTSTLYRYDGCCVRPVSE